MRLIFLLVRLFLLGMSGLIPVRALAAAMEFNLPAQPADMALLAFSKQAESEVLFSFADLHQTRSTEVVGRFERQDALDRLLQGTGFIAHPNRHGKFVVIRAPQPIGSIKGQLRTWEGAAARDIRVTLPATRQTATTNASGEFEFGAVPPGIYRLIVSSAGYQPLQIADLRVEPNRVLQLETKTLHRADEPTQLKPVVVEGRADQSNRFGRGRASFAPQTATGNLDLPRTQDDALPYTIYDREQIARSGVVNLNEFLQRELLESDAAARPADQNGNLDSFISSSDNLSLRGYGSDETVVLVNGRRLPEMLTNFSTRLPPDVDFIPLSLVERIEVLPVSSSALYAGNPVGGVINVVLRPRIEATEITTTYTNPLGGFDAAQSTVSLQHGQTLLGGALRLRLNATFTQTMPATEAELGYIQANLARNEPDAPLHRATPNVRSANQTPLFGPGSASVTSVAPGANGAGGLAAFAGREGLRNFRLFDSPGGLATSPDSLDYPYGRRQRGTSYFASATYDVLPWLQLGLDGIFTHTVVNRGYNVFAGDLTLGADSPFNPFQQDLAISLNETAPLLGEKYSEARLDFSSIVAGLLLQLADWRVSLDSQYGHNVTRYRGIAGVDSNRWQQLVNSGVYNPLRDTQRYGPPPQFYDQVLIYYGGKGRFVTLGNYQTLDAAIRIGNPSLSLPTGGGAINFGSDYRRNQLASYTDEQRYGDGSLAGVPAQWTGRTLQRISVFGELQAPLVPARWLPDWLRKIEADLAVRYTVADTAQETNVAPTAGLKIDFANGLSLRGSIATSNRFDTPYLSGKVAAPGGTAGGGEVVSTSIFDPLRHQTYNVLAQDALNSNLRPEAAITRTVGMLFQRGQTHRFRASVDFVDTQKSGELANLDAQAVMNLEGSLPGRVVRTPLAPGDPSGAGLVTSVLTGNFNLAWRHSQNWNTSLDYAWTECLNGKFELYARWAYFQRFDLQVLPTSPVVDELRAPDGATSGLLKHRLNFGAGYSRPHYGFGIDGHYFHSRILPALEWPGQGGDRIAPYWQFDAFVQSDLTRWLPLKNPRFGLRGQLRINNLFAPQLPKYANDVSGAGVQSYGDWRGRTCSISLTATF